MKWISTLVYGLITIWTGLLRGVEAQAYKPNALWFCMVMGLISIAAGFLFRMKKKLPAVITAAFSSVVVLGFYMTSFITEPEGNATYRVAVIIVASIAECAVIFMPEKPSEPTPKD